MPADLSYDKFLGPMTMKSLDQVMRATLAMQHGWPQGQKLQITFSDKPSPSELNPATLAATLALDSMLRNYDIDPSYAAIGWIQEDGTIEAVGSIPERMLGASRAQIARVVVPEKNYEQLSDYLLSQGMGAFVSTQVFTAKDFNEAGVLAVKNLDPKVPEVDQALHLGAKDARLRARQCRHPADRGDADFAENGARRRAESRERADPARLGDGQKSDDEFRWIGRRDRPPRRQEHPALFGRKRRTR